MSVRRWTPLFFVPTPVLRFVLGDVWWWVPFALWLGGLVAMAWLSIVEWGWVENNAGFGVLLLAWLVICRLSVPVLRGEQRLRHGLPSVLGWWITAHVGWFLPGASLWSVFLYQGVGEWGGPPFVERLRVWVDAGGVTRCSLERWSGAESGAADCSITEVDGAGATELLTALEESREQGFPSVSGSFRNPPVRPPTVVFLRRGSLPVSRRGPDCWMKCDLDRFWRAWPAH